MPNRERVPSTSLPREEELAEFVVVHGIGIRRVGEPNVVGHGNHSAVLGGDFAFPTHGCLEPQRPGSFIERMASNWVVVERVERLVGKRLRCVLLAISVI